MTYVMSDIHGFYNKYQEFMQSVAFSDDDKLYIVGDMIDRGLDGIKIILDAMSRKNVICLMGNHEYLMLPALEKLHCASSNTECRCIISEELAIGNIGQTGTLTEFCALSEDKRSDVLEYLRSLPLYLSITVKERNYLLVHAGLPDFDETMGMEYYTAHELLFGPHDFFIDHFKDTEIIVGHVPTRKLSKTERNRIFKSHDTYDLDCGVNSGGQLGALCLDTGEELYF
ncbi:MAG: metallophosphoesterase [Oscillospiraceae bacterium]